MAASINNICRGRPHEKDLRSVTTFNGAANICALRDWWNLQLLTHHVVVSYPPLVCVHRSAVHLHRRAKASRFAPGLNQNSGVLAQSRPHKTQVSGTNINGAFSPGDLTHLSYCDASEEGISG